MAASSEISLDGAFYEHFQVLLNESIPDCSPAEVQGVLTGLACAGETDGRFGSWGALLPEGGWHKNTAFSTSTNDSISIKLRFIW